MRKTLLFEVEFLIGMSLFAAGVVSAQDYPNKPIRIFTGTTGGGTDLASRLLAQGISIPLGQPVLVENRPTTIGIEAVAKAPPDGYTLLLQGNLIWVQPLLQANVPWDAARDFSPITLAATAPQILVVHPSLPVKSVKELIALAKANPGKLDYSSGQTGGPAHLATELFMAMASIKIMRINYNGGAAALNALIAGQVQVAFATSAAVAPLIKSGRLRPLAVSSMQPSIIEPALPTMNAAGLPGYASEILYVIFAPAKTPPTIINRLNQELVRVLTRPDVKEKLFNSGVEAVGSSPEQLAEAVKADTARMSKVIKDNGIRVE